jgi:glycosyltransferase involved in cell wall biosynthesis
MTHAEPKIAYLTAGGGGMFCGSCMRDNTLAAALNRLGCDTVLVPLYTPIRTDEEDVSVNQVFFGGINVYLQQKVPLFRYLPRFFSSWLDRPGVINRLAAGRINVAARELGELTVSVLQGEHGHQRKEVFRLVDWLEREVQPDLINLSNILIAGCVPEIKQRLRVPVLVTLQGDDLFLEELTEPYKQQALAEIRRVAEHVDGFIVFSRYYADFMSGYLGLDRQKFHVVPLGLSLADYANPALPRSGGPPTVGFLARICPEKGFHLLVDAFMELAKRPGMEQARLHAAGWLGGRDEAFFQEQVRKLERAGLNERFRYAGVVDRRQKLEFLRELDVLSVPTVYHDPKGLFVLEAWASGLPVVQPDHGAFPELLAGFDAGRLVRPGDAAHLAETLHALLSDGETRRALGQNGRAAVERSYSAEAAAARTLDVYRRFTPISPGTQPRGAGTEIAAS